MQKTTTITEFSLQAFKMERYCGGNTVLLSIDVIPCLSPIINIPTPFLGIYVIVILDILVLVDGG